MSFSTYETSQELSRPVEVYRFVVGAQTYRYTSADATFTFSGGPLVGQTFEAEALSRSSLSDSSEDGDSTLKITMPGMNPVAGLFKLSVPGARVNVIVERFQRLDTPTPELIRIFDGYVTQVTFRESFRTAELDCRPAISVLSRTIPRFTFQSRCNHVLYDSSGCQVVATATYKASGKVVSSVSGSELTIAGLGASYPDGWFNGGYVNADGGVDYREVLVHVDDVLELSFPFAIDPSTVDVFAGCDHSPSTCKGKFDNFGRYGGFPFVPTKNPHETGL